MLITIQTKYNQSSNNNIIKLHWWLYDTNIKNLFYKK
jgi:hypothetical protein